MFLGTLTMQSNFVGPDATGLWSTAPSTAAGVGSTAAGVGGRAGEDAARPSADTGSLPAESDAAGPGFSVHADSGLANGSFATAIHSD